VLEDLFSPEKLIILFVILFFLFGAKRLPGLGKSLGHGIREFRGGIAGLDDAAPAEELTAADDQAAALAAGDAGAHAADATGVAPDAVDATAPAVVADASASADASATAEAAVATADPALDDVDVEDAEYTELDGDVMSEVVGEMSEAEGAVATPGPQS
jgi:sec-independent protein translocase protein TatA